MSSSIPRNANSTLRIELITVTCELEFLFRISQSKPLYNRCFEPDSIALINPLAELAARVAPPAPVEGIAVFFAPVCRDKYEEVIQTSISLLVQIPHHKLMLMR